MAMSLNVSQVSVAAELEFAKLGIGCMTFGQQTAKPEAFDILELAVDQSNPLLIDTAEMYPTYPSENTYGDSERIIGQFIKSRKCRDQVVISTKIASKNPTGIGATGLKWIRADGEGLALSESNIFRAVYASLKRLNLDYIDLIQIHWPERRVPMGGDLDFQHFESESWTAIEEIVEIFTKLRKKGLVRYFCVSNESPWGLCKYLSASKDKLEISYTQNGYNLLDRTFDQAMCEISIRENCPLLAYSPLAGGRLLGKYLDGVRPSDARYTRWPGPEGKYHNKAVDTAVAEYLKLSQRFNISMLHLALGFVLSRPYCAAAIFGPRTVGQLSSVLKVSEAPLDTEILKEIDTIHRALPNPAVVGALKEKNNG